MSRLARFPVTALPALVALLALLAAPPATAQAPDQAPDRDQGQGESARRSPAGAPPLEDIDAILEGEEEIFGLGGGYSYDPEGRRDPFKSLLQSSDADMARGPRPEGVPGLLIDEIRLIGIYRLRDGHLAQVQAADQQMSFLLKEGDRLFDGEVVSIDSDEVVFRQDVGDDPTAVKPFRERVKALDP